MSKPAKPELTPQCPSGISPCAIIDELVESRHEIDELRQLIRTDPLTNLSNVRHFRSVLEDELERTQRSGQPTALIMLDLDHFKRVNDTWGHEVGNTVLIHIANTLMKSTRKLDIPCRYGGEEFAVILPTTELHTARQVAERLRESIATTPIANGDEPITITASLGVAIYKYNDKDTLAQFIARADAQLYRAKQSGRNQVCYDIARTQDDGVQVSREEKDLLHNLFGSEED